MNRLLSLDVLRGIAILLVLVRHAYFVKGTFLEPIQRGGWIGVDLFFVLSGFLVSGLLFREFNAKGSIKPWRFLVRRGWKIYPPFFVMIGCTILLCGIASNDWNVGKALAELCFVQSYVSERWWGHTWSLAVEEHFYLLLPFVLMGLMHDNFKSLPRIVAAIMVALLVAKCINGLRPFTEQSHLFPTHLRLDGLFFGVLLAYWNQNASINEWCRRHSKLLIAGGCLLMTPAFIFEVETTPALYTVGLTAQIIGSGAILMGTVNGGVTPNLVTNTLGWIGVYSYSIYLWHNAVGRVIAPLLGIESILFTVCGSVALGVGLSMLIESPMLRLRQRLAPAQ